MTPLRPDEIASFYDRHPYPPPVADLDRVAAESDPEGRRRIEHHLRWPRMAVRDDLRVLVAGCGTSQAARHALRHPGARVIGIDVSRSSLDHTRDLARRHGLDNLELWELPVERVAELERSFDHIVCTGVIHHLADPDSGLRALREVLSPTGALDLMVYAPYGRTGISMLQDYCRRLGVGTSAEEISDLKATLRELPLGHPLSHLLRNTPDFRDDDAIADALLNPRDRSYSVPQVFELLARTGLQFGRWIRQAPYLSTHGAPATIPHAARLAALDRADQYAAVELFRGTMTRHSLIAFRDDAPDVVGPLHVDEDSWPGYVPVVPSTVVVIEERLPPGAAAAVLNRAHQHPDLVLFLDTDERRRFEAVDGRRTIADLGDPSMFRRLWEHDLVVVGVAARSH